VDIFLDTSAFLALLNADDQYHAAAAQLWSQLVPGDQQLVTTNYVLVETLALVQRRLGMAVVRRFTNDVVPLIDIEWLDEVLHEAGLTTFVVANRRSLSLVDCTSFEVMRHRGITTAFTFDEDFALQGFECIPVAQS
jgi:uncharacterized protein